MRMVGPQEIGLIFLFVSDLKRSVEFYVEKLGFQLEYEGEDFVRIRANIGTPIMLHKSHGRDIKSAGFELELKVDDVDVWYKRLTNQGAEFRRPPSEVEHEGDPSGPRREATLHDPDGYRLALFTPLRKLAI